MQKSGILTPRACEDCGSDPVFHGLTKVSIIVEDILAFIAAPGAWAMKYTPHMADTLIDACMPTVIGVLHKLGLGHHTYEVDERDFEFVTHVLWDEAKKRGINMVQFRPFGRAKHLFTAEFNGEKIVFDRIPMKRGVSRGVAWIDDKAILKEHLQKHGMPTAAGEAVRSEARALQLFDALRKPVIVKPHQGSGTRHTTLHVNDTDELLRAFRIAKKISPLVVIEEELSGPVIRPTVIDGKLVATIERHQPSVIGNGTRTIKELIDEMNTHPKRQGPVFSHIKITPALLKELERQHHSLESIPKNGERVFLHQKINWSVGGYTKDVSDMVHEDNKKLFEDIAALLRAPLVGIDFICSDISKSWKEQDMCGVIETNSMPFFDTHHFPFEGTPRNVAGDIWDMVYPASKLS